MPSSKPLDFNQSKTPSRKAKGSTDKRGKKPHSNADYSSDDFDSEDIEIKIQQAKLDRQNKTKKNVVTKEDQVMGIIPLDKGIDDENKDSQAQ